MRWLPWTVRIRLTVWYAGILAVILALYAGGVFAFLRHSLYAELDRQLRDDFEVAEQMLDATPDGGFRWKVEPHHDENDEQETGNWIEVWGLQGKLLLRRPGAEGSDAQPVSDFATDFTSNPRTVEISESLQTRIFSREYRLSDGVTVVMRVVRSEDGLRGKLGDLLLVLGLGLPLAVASAGLGGYALARRALTPVSRMAERARTITAERLGERLPIENPSDELGHLAQVFNDTFARLETSFEELRRFTADASHELRTPLTAIRSVGEVGLGEHRSEAEYREIVGSMLEEVDRLSWVVDNLLTLARADAGHYKLKLETFDLLDMTRDVVNHLEVLAEERKLSVRVESQGPGTVSADKLLLRQALINLLDNAIKYTHPGTLIRIAVSGRPGEDILEITDQGPGIAPEHQRHVFDRFYRIDKARSRDLGGTGLGLAIARSAVEAHGGRIELESQHGQGATFRIILPRKKISQAAEE